jgi:transposase
MGAQRRKFTPEFKAEAVRAVIEDSRAIADVAREYGLVAQTLGNWVTEYRREHAGEEPELTGSEREELERLRKENRELRMEKEFLGKAAAFFAKEYR